MLLWVVLALLTGAAVLAVLWPLSNPHPVAVETGSDVRFYKDQLAEIARDHERGVIGEAEAEAARIESGRRLLRAAADVSRPLDTTSEPALRRRRAASALALSIVPIIGLGIYGGLGSPHLPAQPVEARMRPAVPAETEMAAALSRVEEHLAANPDDTRGWDVVAPIYLRAGRFADASRAYGNARRLGGDTVERLIGQGEALVGAEQGTITPEARDIFRRAVALDPSSPPARYYVALSAEQEGDRAAASAGYRSLVADAPAEAPWLPLVRERLGRLDGNGAAGGVPALPASAVSPEISAMVAGLDGRLKAGGGTEAEWSRLVRSFVVLGRREDAADRLARAKTALAADPGAAGRLDRLASELGLGRAVAHPNRDDAATVPVLPAASVTPEISAMVAGLDERLKAGGGTEAEWSRLVRSFVVLGRREDAADRLARAKTALAGDPGAAGRLDRLALELGLAREIAGQ